MKDAAYCYYYLDEDIRPYVLELRAARQISGLPSSGESVLSECAESLLPDRPEVLDQEVLDEIPPSSPINQRRTNVRLSRETYRALKTYGARAGISMTSLINYLYRKARKEGLFDLATGERRRGPLDGDPTGAQAAAPCDGADNDDAPEGDDHRELPVPAREPGQGGARVPDREKGEGPEPEEEGERENPPLYRPLPELDPSWFPNPRPVEFWERGDREDPER